VARTSQAAQMARKRVLTRTRFRALPNSARRAFATAVNPPAHFCALGARRELSFRFGRAEISSVRVRMWAKR
jgi:hypothetical protein